METVSFENVDAAAVGLSLPWFSATRLPERLMGSTARADTGVDHIKQDPQEAFPRRLECDGSVGKQSYEIKNACRPLRKLVHRLLLLQQASQDRVVKFPSATIEHSQLRIFCEHSTCIIGSRLSLNQFRIWWEKWLTHNGSQY